MDSIAKKVVHLELANKKYNIMRGLKSISSAVILFACATGIYGQNNGASAFIPGCYQSYEMAFVDSSATLKYVEMVSTTDKVAEVNGRKYKLLKTGDAGLGTLYFRQEEGKVYRLAEDRQQEVLCYDFGLEAGDEFTVPGGAVWTVLSTRDTVMNLPMMENFKTHLLTLCRKDNPQIQDTWQEGVGSWHYGPFTPDLLQSYSHVAMLNCLMENQVFEFDRMPLWGSFLTRIHPRYPSDDEFIEKWHGRDSLAWKQDGDTLYISGFVYGFGGGGGLNAWSYIHEGTALVSVLPTPMHSCCAVWYDIDLHIPCHGEIVSRVEVRDVDIPSSVTATLMPVQSPRHSTYDLQGRRIEGKSTPGLYIIGGKKRVVK